MNGMIIIALLSVLLFESYGQGVRGIGGYISGPEGNGGLGKISDQVSFVDTNRKKHVGAVKAIEQGYLVLDTGKGIERIPRIFLPPDINKRFACSSPTNDTPKFAAVFGAVTDEIKEINFDGKVSDVTGDSALGWSQRFVRNSSVGENPIVTAKLPIMIFGLPKGLVDGAPCRGVLYSAGLCQYKTTDGKVKSVKRYATSKELAEKLLSQASAGSDTEK